MKAEDLKNSILQMAMEGKLVPQDPNDEPASVLLERIQKEKEQLIKEKKIKRNNKESFIFRKNNHFYEKIGKNGELNCIDEEIPFEIPESWEISKLSYVNNIFNGNSINKKEKESKFMGLSEGYNYIATKDVMFNHSINYDNGVKIPKNLEKFKIAVDGSVLLCIEGGSAGRKIAITKKDVCFGNKLCCFTSYGINNEFLYYYLQSPIFKKIFKSKKTGIIGGVGIGKIKNFYIPIPPLQEQKRIVKKIDDLFVNLNI
ncbi:restriction endonuclease subunit S [uncultured Methanobrevibacter sp.]|uniref:restriction endonuclease subunit S n=1 Tax=uncultured Methanobrevibacter sp. TaxID=253161 RepID=UPI0025879EC0|nr:restriction endonuclease subunit S [uncultured Methanobrevibacter sp.]